MGSAGFIDEEKDYDPVDDVWHDSEGRKYIKNESNPQCPVWIDISTNEWNVIYAGNVLRINWNEFSIPKGMLDPIYAVVKDKLKTLSLSYMHKTRRTLELFQSSIEKTWVDFADISADAMVSIYRGLNPSYRSIFRELYKELAMKKLAGARPDIAYEMRSWKARKKVVLLREVLEWHETKGALTSSEEEVLRATLRTRPRSETPKQHATRLYGWLLLDTLKRSSQILEIPKNGLKCVQSNGRDEWFVDVRPIKYQTGDSRRWWHISDDLASEIIRYSAKPLVAYLQKRFNRLIVWSAPSLRERGTLSAADGKAALMGLVYKSGAISPRTKRRLHVTPTRIRHTGATRLAFAGVSRDIIQEILEHDSPESCQAYIDAIGSDIVPQIEKAGRAMGNIFFELNKSFFQGKVVSEASGAPIVVPEHGTTPLIAGSCGRDPIKDGGCKKHPFLSCYAECSSFLAWDTPEPHEKALQYFENERKRWDSSGNSDSISIPTRHTLAIFAKAIGSVKEILQQIEGNRT